MAKYSLEKTGMHKFASMNSAAGFISYFDNYFNDLDKLYILKGGPGTGKSYLMKRFAERARQKGYSVKYFHCSSDPDSLDGIIINELSIGMLDGTSPHIRDPRYPGAVENIINLGEFWNEEKLKANKNSIKLLSEEKSVYYSRAVSMLGIYNSIGNEEDKIISRVFNRQKAYDMFCRLFKSAKQELNPKILPFVYESPGMKGIYTSTFPADTKIYKIPPYYSAEFILTDIADEVLCKLGISHSYSFSPFRKERFNSIYIPSLKSSVCVGDHPQESCDTKLINPKRFIDKGGYAVIKKELRDLSKYASPFLENALYCFNRMKKIHFDLEDIYLSSMDLGAKERFTEEFLRKCL